MDTDDSGLSCPSAQPDMEDAEIFGVVAGTPEEPRLAYLKKSAQVDEAMLRSLGPLDPTQVFRYTGRCENSRCAQFANGRCSLGRLIVERLPEVVDSLPSCRIRATCRWFAEEGEAACLRCPQVVTLVPPERNGLRTTAATED